MVSLGIERGISSYVHDMKYDSGSEGSSGSSRVLKTDIRRHRGNPRKCSHPRCYAAVEDL